MEPFKNIYNKESITLLSEQIKNNFNSFDQTSFLKNTLKGLTKLEMKERVIQISNNLHQFLPGPYKKNIKLFIKTLKSSKNPNGLSGFILWPYSHYIETYGLSDFDTSMNALYEITKRFTSEFGIRPFLESEPEKVYKLLNTWVKDKDEHVRRLVSEGTRPNLPWGRKVSHIEKQFSKNIKLLDQLKDDSSEYVQKSVANHMNDISWYDSSLTIKTLKRWHKNKKPEIQWICKQALRSLLKQGDKDALALMGYNSKSKSSVTQLKLSKKVIKEGDSFDLCFILNNLEKKETNYMVDYIIYYPKANGKLSPKTFKLKSLTLDRSEKSSVKKKINFKKVTTRTHYKGPHELHIQVNGTVKAKASFKLL